MLVRMKKESFTLVELLVVIAIISVLAALLLPVLGHMKEVGRRTVCMNNLKECGIALTLYANENGRYPNQRDAIGGTACSDAQLVRTVPNAQLAGEWDNVVEYATGSAFTYADALAGDPGGKLKIFECPDRPLPIQDFSSPNDGTGFVFVMTYFYVAGTISNWWSGGGANSSNAGPPTYSPRGPEDPGDWAVMVDEVWGNNSGIYDPSHPQTFNGGGLYQPAGSNELFNDGHVEWVNWKNGQNTLPIANWTSYAYWRRTVGRP